MDVVDTIVAEVLRRLGQAATPAPAPKAEVKPGIPAEMSARHVHLTAADLKALFGQEELPVSRMISQPGQYLSTLRVRLIGPKGNIDNVAVLGPLRKATQVEISATDARALGISAPVRLSGDLGDAAALHLQAGQSMLCAKAAIVAKRHLHMLPSDAARFGVENGQSVAVRVLGARPLILEDVPVRVTEQSALALHIDTDEANAAGLPKDGRCEIVGREGLSACTIQAAETEKSTAPCSTQPCREAYGEKLLTEEGVRALVQKGAKEVQVSRRTIVTPLARDTAKALGLGLIAEESK